MKKYRFVLLLVLFLLMACGSRKSELQLSVEQKSLDVKQSAQYDIKAETLKNVHVEMHDDGFTLTPVNPDEPMEYTAPDGKKTTVKNGVLDKRAKKETTRSEEKTDVKASGKSESEISATSYKKDKEKKTDREADWSFLWILFLIMILIVVKKLRENMNW